MRNKLDEKFMWYRYKNFTVTSASYKLFNILVLRVECIPNGNNENFYVLRV